MGQDYRGLTRRVRDAGLLERQLLNYQIEHHLFPALPRNRLRAARPIVRGFCRERGVPYHETSLPGSYREILHHLHALGAPLRAQPPRDYPPQGGWGTPLDRPGEELGEGR